MLRISVFGDFSFIDTCWACSLNIIDKRTEVVLCDFVNAICAKSAFYLQFHNQVSTRVKTCMDQKTVELLKKFNISQAATKRPSQLHSQQILNFLRSSTGIFMFAWIFRTFWPKMAVLGAKYLTGWWMLTRQRTCYSWFWRFLPLCHFWQKSIEKCGRESADRQTHAVTETNWIYVFLMLDAIAMGQVIILTKRTADHESQAYSMHIIFNISLLLTDLVRR